MTITITTTRLESGTYVARATTPEGRCIGQAVDRSADKAERRAMNQARKWAADRDWGTLTFRTVATPGPATGSLRGR